MYDINPEIELAYKYVQYTGKNIFLTGRAGTGKTTFLHNLRKESSKRMVVVAPTGVAAINAGGVTIHSFFQLPFGPYIAEYQREQGFTAKKFNREKINILRSLDLVVIDEISMVRADLLDGIDDVMRRFRNRSLPFGGVQLLMIGDLQQLSPVIKEDEWNVLKPHYSTPYFFSSLALQKTDYVSIELKKVYRQRDEKFIGILNKIRENRLDAESLSELNKRYIAGFSKGENEGYITLTTHNQQAQQINLHRLNKLPNTTYTYEAKVEGDFPEQAYPTEHQLVLKEGAQVMFVKNDPSPERLFFNGKIGKVVGIDDEEVLVQCEQDLSPISVKPLVWENTKYEINTETKEIKEKVAGTFCQMPLRLAWAITVHKSQGLTFDKVVINANASFAHGQVYVALSRCRSLEGLVLDEPLAASAVINDGTVRRFTNTIEQNAPTEHTFARSKQEYELQLLTELFSFTGLQRYLYNALRLTLDNPGAMNDSVRMLLSKMVDAFKTEVTGVSEKFMLQLQQLAAQSLSVEENELLQERVQKGCSYFSDKLQAIVYDVLEKLPTDTDNKQVAEQWSDNWLKLQNERRIKTACLKSAANGFTIKDFLQARAKAAIDDPQKALKAKRSNVPSSISNPDLYEELREWRDEKATEYDVVVYQIIQQKTLFELVDKLPATLDELKKVKGLGKKKIQQFGLELLEIIRHYRKEKGLIVPDDDIAFKLDEKPKLNTKDVTLSMFTQGMSVEEIAEQRGMVPSTIEGHLSHFVLTGELAIEDVIMPDKLRIIISYFADSKPASLSEAKQALSDDITWGELRLVSQWLAK